MAIYDRWYRTERADGSSKKVRSGEHGCKERWEVRWRDNAGRQRKKSFERRAAAEGFEADVKTALRKDTYADPSAGQVTFRSFEEDWRPNRGHDTVTAARVEGNLRNHVYWQTT